MPVATHVLTGDFSGLVGEVSRIRATIHANSEDGAWVNDTDNVIRLGGALLGLDASGVFSVTVPTSTGTGLQYEVRAQFTDLSTAPPSKQTWRSGWFDMTADANLAAKALDSSLRVTASLGAQLAARTDGVTDHGSVSGAVAIDPAISTHWLDATGATVLTIGDGPSGGTRYVSILPVSGASNILMADPADATLNDGTFATFAWVRGAWILAGSGGSSGPADTTPPTAITDLTATGGAGQIDLAWSAATDADSTVHYRYRAWLTSGGATGSWLNTDTTTATITGLTAGAYTAEVYAYSTGGSTTPDTATATVTGAVSTVFLDTFTRPDGSLGSNPTPDVGPNWGGQTGVAAISSNQLNCGTGVVTGALTTPAQELTIDAVVPDSGGYVQGGVFGDGAFNVKIKGNGQIEFNGSTGVTYNASGGTNPYTPIGYLTGTTHTLRVTYSSGTADLYVDGVKTLTATYGAQATDQLYVTSSGTGCGIDRVEVKG